jgi:hypothetical protein
MKYIFNYLFFVSCSKAQQNIFFKVYWLWCILLLFMPFFKKITAAAYRLSSCCFIKNPVSIWNWLIPKYNPQKLSSEKKKVSYYVMYKIVIKVDSRLHLDLIGCCYYRIWEEQRNPPNEHIKRTKNMFVVTERFL